jgi:hypothetical protein
METNWFEELLLVPNIIERSKDDDFILDEDEYVRLISELGTLTLCSAMTMVTSHFQDFALRKEKIIDAIKKSKRNQWARIVEEMERKKERTEKLNKLRLQVISGGRLGADQNKRKSKAKLSLI